MAPLIAAVILAAGESRRLGRPKQLLEHGGQTLLRHVVDCAGEAGCDPILVVVGAHESRVRAELRDLAVVPVLHAGWREGIGSSVRAGVEALSRHAPAARAVLLLACDQPRLTPGLIRRMSRRLAAGDVRVVACAYAGTVGTPALFDRSLFAELGSLSGTVGAKPVLERHGADLARVPWPDGAIDVDHPEDTEGLG